VTLHIPLGDRRVCLRFEATGQVWGALKFQSDLQVRNLATGGMLVEAVFETPFKPLRAAQIRLPEEGCIVDAIVRHVTPLSVVSDKSQRYLIGFEFVNVTPPTRLALEEMARRWAAASSGVDGV
jgi:hypothetical protein